MATEKQISMQQNQTTKEKTIKLITSEEILVSPSISSTKQINNGTAQYKVIRLNKEIYDVINAVAKKHHTKIPWMLYTMALEYHKKQKDKGIIQKYGEEFAKLF